MFRSDISSEDARRALKEAQSSCKCEAKILRIKQTAAIPIAVPKTLSISMYPPGTQTTVIAARKTREFPAESPGAMIATTLLTLAKLVRLRILKPYTIKCALENSSDLVRKRTVMKMLKITGGWSYYTRSPKFGRLFQDAEYQTTGPTRIGRYCAAAIRKV